MTDSFIATTGKFWFNEDDLETKPSVNLFSHKYLFPMNFRAIISVVLCCHVNAQRNAGTTAYDVFLKALGFGPCTDQPQRCGFRDRGYKMIKTDDDNGSCTEICSTMPYLNIGYQCGTCKVTCPEETTIPCLQGIGLTLFRLSRDGSCDEICIIGSAQADGYSCGKCDQPISNPPTVSPTRQPFVTPSLQPLLNPSLQPVATPIGVSQPVSLPVAPVAIPSATSSEPVATSLPIANPTSLRYDITLQLVDVSNEDRAIFEAAAALWESAIIGDLPDVEAADFDQAPFVAGCNYPTVVDDLYICGTMTTIDGIGGVAGRARPTYIRTGDDDGEGSLPSAGEMIFDLADIDDLRAKGLTLPLVAHEMGHVLGIGSTWEFLGVTGAIANNCPYVGMSATEEYKLLSGCDTIPIEQDGNTGSRCKHWSETCLVSELMTTILDEENNPMSRVTIGGLEDLGYDVDYANAGVYTSEDIDPSCLCNNRKERQLLRQKSSLFDGKHGDVVLLDDLIPGPSRRANRERRQLSESLRQYAVDYGLQILDESASRSSWASAVLDLRQGDNTERSRRNPKRVRFAGHYYISIIMRQGDDFFGVLVVRDSNET